MSYFTKMSDDEIISLVENLSPSQRAIFDDEVESGKTIRHALFIAKSYSCEKEGKAKG